MINPILTFFKTKILRDNKARWNKQYEDGKWEGLKDELELERQQVCWQFMNQFKPQGSILEIGCGEGVFAKNVIPTDGFSNYLGVDVSDFIIQKAQSKLANEKTNFVQDDMDDFKLKQPFDIIFFNESLNYAKSISNTLAYCQKYLSAPDAIFVISLHQHKHSPKYWHSIHEKLKPLSSKFVKNERAEWQIEVLK